MLPIRPGQKLPEDPAFTHPPQWIHEAGKWLFSTREAKKRAVLRLIDQISPKQPSSPRAAPRSRP